MSSPLTYFKHVFINNNASRTLFLLHGTGGDERDLLPLVESVGDRYNFVGLKGNISEHGLTRFFERTAVGVFNQESIKTETKKLAEFLKAWCEEHNTSSESVAFLGYSNGANMILALLFLFPELISQAVLLHPMLPFEPKAPDFKKKILLVSYGLHDQMIPAIESQKVIATLEAAQAKVEVVTHPGGHEIRSEEIQAGEKFLA